MPKSGKMPNKQNFCSQISLKFETGFIWHFKMPAGNPSYALENLSVKKREDTLQY